MHLAAGPWMAPTDSTYAARVVLRNVGEGVQPLVVHLEVDPGPEARNYFVTGDYFAVSEFPAAVQAFADRVRHEKRRRLDLERGVAWGLPTNARAAS